MNFVSFLLIGSLSISIVSNIYPYRFESFKYKIIILQGKSDHLPPLIESDIENLIPGNKSITACITGLKEQKLQLLKGGKLGKTDHALVWKGMD